MTIVSSRELGKTHAFLQKGGGSWVIGYIEQGPEETVKSEWTLVIGVIGQYPIRKDANLQLGINY